MQTMTANEAKTHFGKFIDKAQRTPVGVMRRGRLVGVMVSVEDYEQMRKFYANRLLQTLCEVGEYAASQGLTEEKLAELLADES
ncbi:MAG: type II toxin-antitoxin system Phd/YefM family antitoxin [Thiothrix sp.]|uniref:type II toxin-antitoxin system Phd/YefM family antitoxin n=1 Tax=Thiothrix sp. TaxID=1032 RepID=UPI0026205A96|nr:type II toxin-antitoxin system Phd/YefM family antitoxin [Thiothrix sp.]MDD5392318.1 type II toxin-antitoxin system Phd/YefM family antitoxin [Thiothrix sp.]